MTARLTPCSRRRSPLRSSATRSAGCAADRDLAKRLHRIGVPTRMLGWLGAIMFTDRVGYSALAQRNEALALDLLAEHQRRLRPIFLAHGGREIKTTGDGFLVEFTSALRAVRCAVAIQTALVEQNASASPDRRIQARIGLHLGDVEVRDGDVFGDGVNIAARIEPLAEAGGICITGPVFCPRSVSGAPSWPPCSATT